MTDAARKVAITIRSHQKKEERSHPHHHGPAAKHSPKAEHAAHEKKVTHGHDSHTHHETHAHHDFVHPHDAGRETPHEDQRAEPVIAHEVSHEPVAPVTTPPVVTASQKRSLSKILSDLRDLSLSGMRKDLDPQQLRSGQISDEAAGTPAHAGGDQVAPEPESSIVVQASMPVVAPETSVQSVMSVFEDAPQVIAPLVPEVSVTPTDAVVAVPDMAPTFSAPRSVVVPKKPNLLEGMNMSALSVAYFCMEIALENRMPTYAGGLGVLAGDMLKSCADLRVPAVGVTLLYRKGYFTQKIDASGWQHEEDAVWNPADALTRLPQEVAIMLEGRTVRVRAWLYKITGIGGNTAPVIFLDTDVPGNSEEDRHITDRLYDSDQRWRFLQESVLGIAGVRMLEAVGANRITKYHMNEGHAALLTLELYRRYESSEEAIEEVRARAVFTTHTPVAAGHDHFEQGMVNRILGTEYIPAQINNAVFENGTLNMTRLGFNFSNHINGVAKRHGVVARELFPGYRIESITNGVYAREWVSAPFARLFDRFLPGWQADPHSLRYVLSIPLDEITAAHREAKLALIEHVNETYRAGMHKDYFTIGFARRATAYKRAHMLFSDPERLARIAKQSKGIQIIFAGKAHPADNEGKQVIQRVIESMRKLDVDIRCLYIEDYDLDLGKLLVSGVDLWLNTPMRPQEASGTSGMKAALNGVPQCSTLDGWWLEGHIEGVTGWSIGIHPERGVSADADREDADDLYRKLESIILPKFEHEHDEWARIMRQTIAINGSFFNSHRMVEQYVLGAYFIA